MSNRFGSLMALVETLLYRLPYPRIIAVSHSTANALISRWSVRENRISVISNGIEIPVFPEGTTHVRNIDLLFAGRFVPTKNIDDLLEIVKLCHQAGAIQRAVLVGEGPLLETMIQKANALGLSQVVEFTGRKSNTEVMQLIQRSKVFFHASSREGFPIVMIEALACGVPVVAYNIPGSADVIDHGKTGILVKERDISSHAQACMELLRSEKLRRDMGSAGQALVSNSMNIATMTDAVLRVYQKDTANG